MGESAYLYNQLNAEYKGWHESQNEDTSMYSGETISEAIGDARTEAEGIEVIQSMDP
jgi:hypothetical protein